ncbi:hypothetical protein V5738_15275 [Salinisphaera sp. SPP-AMP-43]|uniref:hypothetical protein n=1 Tax=Salinisphaera sp. SPP-AMP-43 TaxID=3121288 RepID=UPI003C6DCBBA
MKHATLQLLTGLICLASASAAIAGNPIPEPASALTGFDNGIPVFELPEVVVTADDGPRGQLSQRRDQRPAVADSRRDRSDSSRTDRAEYADASADYTAMRLVDR